MARLLIDAGVAIRFAVSSDPQHTPIAVKVKALAEEGWELCFAPQAIREAWNVLTRPSKNGGYEMPPSQAERALQIVWASFTFLEEKPEVFRHWQLLATTYGLVGKSVHDANVVAAALAHDATHILTLNERDFRRYREIEIIGV